MTVHELAEILIEYGDVVVVKCAPNLYWVDFESFETEVTTATPTLLVERDDGQTDMYPIN